MLTISALTTESISIFESEIEDKFRNYHKLSMTMTEIASENILKNDLYDKQQYIKILVDYNNQDFLHPVILSTYSGFEYLMQRLCYKIESGFGMIDIDDNFYSYRLDDIKIYLKGKEKGRVTWNCSLFDENLKKDWNLVQLYQKLRIIIAHYNGNYEIIPASKQNKFEPVIDQEHVEIAPNGMIILGVKLPKIYIDYLNSILNKLMSRVKNYKNLPCHQTDGN